MASNVKGVFSRKNAVWQTVAGLVIAAGILYYFISHREQKTEYLTDTVTRGNIHNELHETGTLQAVLTVTVGSQISGEISALYADYNSVVKEGQLLATIDPRHYQAVLGEAQANLGAAEASVKNSEAALNSQIANTASAVANMEAAKVAVGNTELVNKRYAELAKEGILDQNDADTAQANYDSAVAKYSQAKAQVDQSRAQEKSLQAAIDQTKAQVVQDQAAVDDAKLNVSYCTIRSPANGVVVTRSVDVGQTVAASLQAPILFVIANDLTKIQVSAQIDEADIGNINDASSVTFSVDAFPNRTFTGKIAEVRLNSTTVQNVTTYQVIINADNPRLELKPGMTANITVSTAHVSNVLRLPNAATRYLPPGVTREQVADMLNQAGPAPASHGAEPVAMAATAPILDPATTPKASDVDQDSGHGHGHKSGRDRNNPAAADADGGQGRYGNHEQETAEQKIPIPPELLAAEQNAIAEEKAQLAPGQKWDPAQKIEFPPPARVIGKSAVVWVLGPDQKLQPRRVNVGVTDGKFSQVVSGDLQEGEQVVIGDSSQAAPANQSEQRGPNMFGGFGGGGGGFRR